MTAGWARGRGTPTTGVHPNALAYRTAADAFRAGELETIRLVIAADVVWHVPGGHPMAGEIRGLDALMAWLGRLRGLGFTLREHDVFGNDEHVCALGHMGTRRPGVEVETRVVSVFHFRAGKQVERWIHPEDMAAWDRIFTEAPLGD